MTAVSNVQSAGVVSGPRPASQPVPAIPDIHDAIERMRVRVNAVHAHRNSLGRSAQGLRAIHRHLSVLLEDRVTRQGWITENRMADAALDAMVRQLDVAGREGIDVAVERESLQHAVFRAVDAATLLEP